MKFGQHQFLLKTSNPLRPLDRTSCMFKYQILKFVSIVSTIITILNWGINLQVKIPYVYYISFSAVCLCFKAGWTKELLCNSVFLFTLSFFCWGGGFNFPQTIIRDKVIWSSWPMKAAAGGCLVWFWLGLSNIAVRSQTFLCYSYWHIAAWGTYNFFQHLAARG